MYCSENDRGWSSDSGRPWLRHRRGGVGRVAVLAHEQGASPLHPFLALAAAVGDYLAKGKRAGVKGRLQIRSYEKNGERRYMTEVIAQSVEFLSDREKTEEAPEEPKKTRRKSAEKTA